MKRAYLILLAIVLLPAFSMAITNGNFGTNLDGWGAYQCTAEWESGSAPFGYGGHAKITNTAGAASFSQNETEANSGESWKWTGYVYCDGSWAALDACWMDDYDYTEIASTIVPCSGYTSGWTLVESTVTLTSDTQNRVWFGSYGESTTGHVAYIDEVQTIEVTEVTDWNLY
jgi:hypothetical protein